MFFNILSTILIFSCLMVVFSRNAVYSVLFLVFAFLNASIIFLISNAEFLAMTLIIVYVGAVAVLFLFVVMMLNINSSKVREGLLKYLPFGILLSLVFVGELYFIFKGADFGSIVPKIDTNELIVNGTSNTKAIGLYLYTDYFIIFQMSAYVLLVAMIGAIVLAFKEKKFAKSQNVYIQNTVKKETLIKLTDSKKRI